MTTGASAPPNDSPSSNPNDDDTNQEVSQQKQEVGAFQAPVQKQADEAATTIAPFQFKPDPSSNNGMPEDVRGKMENAFQADFSNVNIHQDSQSATDVGALAYT